MNLPENIEEDIVNYLQLEFGENSTDKYSLKVNELHYEGEYFLNGIKTHFWWFPSGSMQCWATLQTYEESYLIAMTTEAPSDLESA